MKIEVQINEALVAHAAATFIAAEALKAVAARGRFVLAVSGGRTPWVMLRALAKQDVPWACVQLVQVDERVAPPGDADRNLTHLRKSLLAHAPLTPEQIHAVLLYYHRNKDALDKYLTDWLDRSRAAREQDRREHAEWYERMKRLKAESEKQAAP